MLDKRNIKNEWGSVTLITLATVMIIITVLSSYYVLVSLKRKSQLTEVGMLSNSYYGNMTDIYNGIMSNTIYQAKKNGNILSTTDNVTLLDDNKKEVTIPANFKIASDSATDVNQGIVIQDASSNQYVWIPCTMEGLNDDIKYDRYAFTRTSSTGVNWANNQTKTGDTITENGVAGNFTEIISQDEQNSIVKYKGFYIGRYEAGITTARTAASSGTTAAQLGAVLEQKGKATYTFVTRDQAASLSTELKTNNGYNVTTKLCSSYAWDTTLTFIGKSIIEYPTDSAQGNYDESGSILTTGSSSSVCNIYDMGGNVWEWTSEADSDAATGPCVTRGGSYLGKASTTPAAIRGYGKTTDAMNTIGFRISLFL